MPGTANAGLDGTVDWLTKVATASDQSVTFGYNPAGQITSRTGSNDAYAYTGRLNVNRPYAVNALNQYTSSGGVALAYDARGNLTQSGAQTYQYNTRNRLYGNGTGQLFYHDPAGNLGQVPGVNLDYVGGALATEFINGVARRYVYGPGTDEPLVWYEGAGTGDRRFLHADERGSVIAVSDNAGNALAINRYDEFGIPAQGNLGRFQYTGQKWVAELSCPLLSGPSTTIVWTEEGTTHASEEAQARGDHRQAA